ncbi:hemicentin-1-like isoform X2 [Ostrea edulis]|uniref:hemicentin-1-like isoform X2 n=1 Tax=Ostrea edulis TaxID=37623 RepID=UPI0024AF502A|nr:hemicentin-1-like isoform X2 [Ostrea edulis]XP_048737094.2 hemicentin-1-like isoform X2 [Ostrea edulis]
MANCYFVFKRELIHVLFLVVVSVAAFSYKRQVPPSFLDTGRRNITVPRGGLAELRCRIRNLGPKEVAWRKLSMDYPLTVGTFVFEKDDHISVDHQDISDDIAEWNLIIKRVEPRHSGTYECQISSTRVLTYHVHLHILDTSVEDESAIDLDGTKYVNLNDPITLTCNATFGKDALSSVQVDWFFNGEIIKSGDPRWLNRLRIAQYITSDGRTIVSQLHISHSLKRDDGQYVCRTINYMNGRQETDSMDVIVLNTNKDISKRTYKVGVQEAKGKEVAGRSKGNTSDHVRASFVMNIVLFLIVVLR